MSNAVFPALPGLKWDIKKTPEFSTCVQTSASGKENVTAYWSYPRWQFELSYELLRDTGVSELKTLMGFFLQRQGRFDSFLFNDTSDNSITGQQIGVGDGSATRFQLVRTLGGFVEPMKAINGTPTIYLAGIAQASGWSVDSSGIVTFSTAPGTGVSITADFTYYFRCRFLQDTSEFSQFMYQLWENKKVQFKSIK